MLTNCSEHAQFVCDSIFKVNVPGTEMALMDCSFLVTNQQGMIVAAFGQLLTGKQLWNMWNISL